MKKLTELLRNHLWTAIDDYRRYTDDTAVLDDVTDSFVDRLAEDSAHAKRDLRNLFCQSDGWDENLQAIVINGTKTHNPDFALVRSLADKILNPVKLNSNLEKRALIDRAICFFARPCDNNADYISAILSLAPNAYRANKKPSRIFRALCSSLGVADETKGSSFQKLFAQFADELNGRQLDFKLFVSINPCHFLTMSNPKRDSRGSMLTSCHSFNSTDYEYNNGCSGYARDNVSFIVFTVADPDLRETLNNRKTSRQIFAYKPFNGLLLQSRLYNTNGGTHGEQQESFLFRDLVQRQISALERIPNLWHTDNYFENKRHIHIEPGFGFGGYPDWTFSDFGAKLSIHDYHLDDFQIFSVGTYGLCISCADEISEKLYCEECNPANREPCDECEYLSYELTSVINQFGERIRVCDSCLEQYYRFCAHCDEYHHIDTISFIDNHFVCDECQTEFYCQCDECGELFHRDNLNDAFNQGGDEVLVCDDCRHDHYELCECCQYLCHDSTMHTVHDLYNHQELRVCCDCRDNHYQQCSHCGVFFHHDDILDGLCSDCRRSEQED